MSHEEAIEDAEEALRSRAWRVFDYNEWIPRRSIPSGVKFTLYSVGRANGYYVAAEVKADPGDDRNQRVNLAWFDTDSWEPVVAFEIAGGVPTTSIDKLRRLGRSTTEKLEKVIVSKSPNPTYIKQQVSTGLPADFHHIDVGFYEHR